MIHSASAGKDTFLKVNSEKMFCSFEHLAQRLKAKKDNLDHSPISEVTSAT